MKGIECCLILSIFVLCNIITSGTAQDDDPEDNSSRTFRFHEHARPCNYRRQQGYCRRRSECKKATRSICRFGRPPVVCCLDEPEPITTSTTTRTTTKRPATTKAAVSKPDALKNVDLTFPGCGSRDPRIWGSSRSSSNGRSMNRGGLFSRLGKRSASSEEEDPETFIARSRRQLIKPVIVGGVTAKKNSWPWMVAIFKETSPRTPKRFLCGASLISRKYVLSAAHCFDGERGDIDPSKFFVSVGAHRTDDGTEYAVKKIQLHPDYKPRQYYNDMSLLQIAIDIPLASKVYPVCLPSDGLRDKIIPQNNNVIVTGWGDTSFGGVSSKVLQEVEIAVVPQAECNASYSQLALNNFPRGITNLFLCAGVKEGGKDACQGDSGGPLVTKLKDESYVQLGIVSFGHGCARAGFPGVYTRVSEFIKWLYDNTDLGK